MIFVEKRLLKFVCIVGCIMSVAHADPIPSHVYGTYSPTTDANSTNSSVETYTGSGNDINNNLARPLLSTDQMKTFSGTNFSSQIACPATNSFLELFIAPGPSGDITTAIIQQDLDNDGVFDYMFTVPVPISGVCANGIISCNPGTWTGCQAYSWQAGVGKQVSLAATGLSGVGGCYCVNNDCGTGLVMANINNVLGDLGGGATAKVAQIDPLNAISRVDVSGTTINYYGQDVGNCGMSGVADQTSYYSNASQLLTDGANAAALAPPGSAWDVVSTSSAASESSFSLYTCSVTRNITLDEVGLSDIIQFNGGTGVIQPCGPGCASITIGTTAQIGNAGQACRFWEKNLSIYSARPDRITGAVLKNVLYDDWARYFVSSALYHEGVGPWFSATEPTSAAAAGFGCEVRGGRNITLNADLTALFTAGGPVDFKVQNASGGSYGYAYAYAEVYFDETCRAQPDTVINTCSTYEVDPECSLEEEIVDGTYTYQNYNPTGLSPLPSTQNIIGTSCILPQTRNWWVKNRTYKCNTGTTYNFDQVYQRKDTVSNSATPTDYTDYKLDKTTGSWGTVTGNTMTSPSAMPTVGACTQACKTRKPRNANDVAGMGTTQSQRNATTTYDFFYHECDATSACPMGPGEALVEPCQCMDEFGEATAIMQSMRLAGRDLICTSGTLTPLP